MKLEPSDALLVVDVQRDFCPGGALAVPEGDRVVPVLKRAIELFDRLGLAIYFSRDWHPADHVSFRACGGPWPVHCVAGTPGAAFHPGLPVPPRARVLSKATEREREAYSAFEGTGLREELRASGVRRLLVGGLATDYCVKASVLDALKAGFPVALLAGAMRGVDLKPGDAERALREMAQAGAREVRFQDLKQAPPGGKTAPGKD